MMCERPSCNLNGASSLSDGVRAKSQIDELHCPGDAREDPHQRIP